jgi:glycosyltransferase involved in cell wall biosynthesis
MSSTDATRVPRVSVALPVYNGERLLARALDSLLAQDFEDFELIICDNASVDGTRELCLAYGAKDPRIRYVRNQRNIGVFPNFNKVVELARGEYFKWAAHDDWCDPRFLGRCVEVLDGNQAVGLCITQATQVDEEGNQLVVNFRPLDLRSPDPAERFKTVLWSPPAVYPIYGVARTGVLRRSRLFRSHSGADRIIIAELSLLGQIWQVPELLFFDTNAVSARHDRRPMFFDAANRDRPPFKHWQVLAGHLAVVLRSSELTPGQKLDLARHVVARYGIKDGRMLLADVRQAGRIILAGDWR